MNQDNFIVRTELDHVTRFADLEAWSNLGPAEAGELREHVAGLPTERESGHVTARMFDLLCVNLQLALLRSTSDFMVYRDRLIEIAGELETLEAIPVVRAQLPLIQELQTEEFWRDINVSLLERVRRRLRDLVQLIERKSFNPVYSALTDEIGPATQIALGDFTIGINLAQYRRKVEAFIRANEHHVSIARLRLNKALTPTDLLELERFVYESDPVGGREQFENAFGNTQSLPAFIRSLVGMDRVAAKEAFARFLDDRTYASRQIRFIEMIIDRLTQQGRVTIDQLYEPPFTGLHYEGVDGVFSDADANAIAEVLQRLDQIAA